MTKGMTRITCGLVGLFAAVGVGEVALGGSPPPPPNYDTGVVVNGDFEANSGSLDGWTKYLYTLNSYGGASAYLFNDNGNHEADLSASAGDNPSNHNGGAIVRLYQYINVPGNASNLQFLYSCQGNWDVGPQVSVVLGSSFWQLATYWQRFRTDANWYAFSQPIPDALKGKSLGLQFEVDASDLYPVVENGLLQIDYVSVTPEPGSVTILVLGVFGLLRMRHGRRTP